jgi:hypothetical protein
MATPFHLLEWPNTLQTMQNNLFIGCPMPEIYSFSAQIYSPKKRLVQFSLVDKFKKTFNGFFFNFLSWGGKF